MLQEQDRQKLDGIVKQMISNKESDSNINLVVNDFKQKYTRAQDAPVTEPEQITKGTLLNPLREGVGGLKTLYGGGEQGIANKLKTNIQEGAKDIQQGNVIKGVAKTGIRVAGDILGTVYAPVGAALQATGINKVFDFLGDLSQKGGNYNPINLITDSKMVQDFVMERPNLEEDFGRALNLAFAKAETGKIDPKTVVSRTIDQVQNLPGQTLTKVKTITKRLPEDIINKRVQELDNISSNYAKLRKDKDFNPIESNESIKRVASTDVLTNAVDENGLIRTKQPGGAAEQYESQTLTHAEDVVRRNLERLNEKVNLGEVEVRLSDAVNKSGLEGADLKISLGKIKREIEGYRLKADAEGNVPLTLIQDAKISKYKNTNFLTPAEIQSYNKAIGKGLKETVEKNSTFNVKEVNVEIGKYLRDIEFIKSLDGKKVKEGKLGKYFAGISGNIIGGAVGTAIGGPVGTAIGAVVGGNVGAKIKGSSLQKTLGGKTGYTPPRNPVIDKAVESANYSRSLGTYQSRYQAPKVINKNSIINQSKINATNNNTAPINKTSNRIIDNTIPQKKNIFQRAVDKYKSLPNKQGGFVRIGGKEFKSISESTKKEMIQVIDYLRGKEEFNFKLDTMKDDLITKYNINQDWSEIKISNKLEELISQTKTKK